MKANPSINTPHEPTLRQVALMEYFQAVATLANTALYGTSGGRAAAQVLLSAYNGDEFHLDVTDLCVLDEKRSVTNDVEAVLGEVREALGGLGGRRVIYQDSDGIFDVILVTPSGRFQAFAPLGELTLDDALAALKAGTGRKIREGDGESGV